MKYIFFCFLILNGIITSAQTEFVFHGIRMGDSLQQVKAKLSPHFKMLNEEIVSTPVFPLAEKLESHLIGVDGETERGVVDEVAFTFADNKLSMIQAKGNAYKVICEGLKDTAQTFMHYKVYWDDLVVADISEDKVWILTEEGAHPNLFAWHNPYLPSEGGQSKNYDKSGAIPDFIRMGAGLDEMRPLLENASDFIFLRELGPEDPNAQIQIDCFGIEYAGFPRKFEARFGDGKLNTVWILTAKAEEDRIRQKLIAAYGHPIFKNDAWEVFENWQVFLRKDKPEVLLLTPELGAYYKKEYFKQQ
ncbi:MAG: hypothetical protein WBM43_13530 [Flavobacteriaceae bacterium]